MSWTLILLPRSPAVSPIVVDHLGPPPDVLRRHAGEDLEVELPPTVYARRLTLPGEVAVYTTDDLATARLAAGIPADLPRPADDRVLIQTAGPTLPLPGASVLELPAGRARRARERAVLAEEDAHVRAASAENVPNLAALVRERRRPVPPRPGDCSHRRAATGCPVCHPPPPPRIPGAEAFDPDWSPR